MKIIARQNCVIVEIENNKFQFDSIQNDNIYTIFLDSGHFYNSTKKISTNDKNTIKKLITREVTGLQTQFIFK